MTRRSSIPVGPTNQRERLHFIVRFCNGETIRIFYPPVASASGKYAECMQNLLNAKILISDALVF